MVTINLPEFPTTSVAIDKWEVLSQQKNLIKKIKENAEVLTNFLNNQYPLDYNPYNIDEDLIYKAAFNEAYIYINDNLYDWTMTFCLGAIFNTPEYNYYLYIEKFSFALGTHLKEAIKIKKTGNRSFNIIVDFSPLGHVEEWASAVEAARSKLNVKNLDADLRSRFWREKIYGTGREGVTITKEYKGRGKNKKGSGTKDITDRYSGKYEETIKLRLGAIRGNKAPFWYLIDKGNVKLSSDIGGTPYPVNPPTNFTRKLQIFLESQFIRAIAEFDTLVRNWISKRYEEFRKRARKTREKEIQLEDVKIRLNEYEDGAKSIQVGEERENFFTGTTKKIGEADIQKIPEIQGQLETYKKITTLGNFYEQVVFRTPSGKFGKLNP